MTAVVTIGDALWDEVSLPDENPVRHAGGAGLNLAVGLAKFGLVSVLAAKIGHDQAGFRLRRFMRERHVALIETPNADFTGVVTSTRDRGEPSYYFPPQLFRRRIYFGTRLSAAMAQADAVAVNSFPFGDAGQVDRLEHALSTVRGLTVVDPNPRPRLIRDLAAYRHGVERAAASASVVKLSSEDAVLLYGRDERDAVATFLSLGPRAVIFTRGSAGATAFLDNGSRVDIGTEIDPADIVDTMGAGDATLASVIFSLVTSQFPDTYENWRSVLARAMAVAAATCRTPGGQVVLPEERATA